VSARQERKHDCREAGPRSSDEQKQSVRGVTACGSGATGATFARIANDRQEKIGRLTRLTIALGEDGEVV